MVIAPVVGIALKKAPILYIQDYGLGTKDGVGYEAAGGFCRGDQPRPYIMRLSRLGRIGHAGRIAGRVGAVVPPFLSPTMWEQLLVHVGGWRHGLGFFG